MYKPSEKNDRHDIDLYWTTTIKYTIQWFLFLSIMEHTANILNRNEWLIYSLLNLFAMFDLHLIDDRDKL